MSRASPIERIQTDLDLIRLHATSLKELQISEDSVIAFFIDRIDLAIENTAGCVLLAKASLTHPVAVLARSMLELTIVTFWAASTKARALEAADAQAAEAKRVIRGLLSKGHGRIVNKTTGENESPRFMKVLNKDAKNKRKQISQIAQECGLGRFYERFYPAQSMPSHGHSLKLPGYDDRYETQESTMMSVHTYLRAIHFIVFKRITQSAPTTLAELEKFLQVGLVPPASQD